MSKIIDQLNRVRDDLNGISPSFCLAKWLQHTLYLQTGMNHSCHHPPVHKIPIHEIEKNPAALHNTQHKKKEMQMMLDGKRPSGCDYCWRVEDMGKEHFSDRVYKSNVSWSKPRTFDVLNAKTNDINPSYLEISFSNVCNLKCAYCSPDLSSKWYDEIKQHGAYPTTTKYNSFEVLEEQGKKIIPNREYNPYVDAFWKWWPDLYPSLHTLRLTGGEPLMSKDCWSVMDKVSEDPSEELTLSINSNLSVPDHMIDRLIEFMLKTGPKLKEIQIFTSGESVGKQAEYARYGLEYDRWYRNCQKILDATYGKMPLIFSFMTTVNILSATTYHKFIEDVVSLRKKYITNHIEEGNRLPMMTNYLRYPHMLAICNLNKDAKDKVLEHLEDVVTKYALENYHMKDCGFIWDDEIDQIKRLCQFMYKSSVGNVEQNRFDFGKFIAEYDKRRNTNFSETFPDLIGYYNLCKGTQWPTKSI
jgi:organic radical activating enzyme